MRVWATSSIHKTFAQVTETGRSVVANSTPRAAALFRQALYGHQRRNPALPLIRAELRGSDLIVTRRYEREPETIRAEPIP